MRGARGHDHVEFVTDLANLPRTVGDPIAFRRILENLIANAVDSLAGKPGRITVSTAVVERDADSRAIRVVIADSGCGMTSDEAGKIFNDFYTTKASGTGLGLSIVRRLVMDLDGSVRVDSAPGRGTQITIDLPASGAIRT